MNGHLSANDLAAFAAGRMTAADRLRADDHLAQCDRCQRAAAQTLDLSGSLDDAARQLSVPLSAHLTDEELGLFVDNRLPADRRETTIRHLEGCLICTTQVEELREWAASPSRVPAPRRWSILAVAAGIALCLLAPAAIWRLASGRVVTPSMLAGIDSLSTADRSAVENAIGAGVAALPPLVAEIAQSREVLMGGTAARGSVFEVLTPAGTATVSDRPTFRWTSAANADDYIATIFDESAQVVARSRAIAQTSWTPDRALPRDRTYVWQVEARSGGATTIAPTPPASPARFHVVDEESARLLGRLEADHPQAHVLLAVLYTQRGVLNEAARHWHSVPTGDTYGGLARRSLQRLEPTDGAGGTP